MKFDALAEALLARLLGSDGTLSPAVRGAILARAALTGGATRDGGEVPAALVPLVDKVARHAYKVTDEDYDRLRHQGYTEDQLFEASVSAATGAAWARLDRGLSALRGGRS